MDWTRIIWEITGREKTSENLNGVSAGLLVGRRVELGTPWGQGSISWCVLGRRKGAWEGLVSLGWDVKPIRGKKRLLFIKKDV